MFSFVTEQLSDMKQQIAAACRAAGRSEDEVELLAVSKTFPAEVVREAYDAGQRHFGESRWQEAEGKIAALPSQISWHFIGSVQRNKVRKLLPLFDTIHAMDSLRLAEYTDMIAAELGLTPKIFLQVNLANEESKGGFSAETLRAEMEALLALKHLDIIGLMMIPPVESEDEKTRDWFRSLRELRDELQKSFNVMLPSLSMGMSGDFALAIAEGATHVRIGTAIFGKRSYRVEGELGA